MANEKVLDTINHLGNANDSHNEVPAERLKKPKLTQLSLMRTQNTLVQWKSAQPLWKAVRQHLLKLNLWPSNGIPRSTVTCSLRDEQGWDIHSSMIHNNQNQETQKPIYESLVTRWNAIKQREQTISVRTISVCNIERKQPDTYRTCCMTLL